jgi:hypothetical protein
MKKMALILVVIGFAFLMGSVYAGNSLGSGYAVTSDWHGNNVPLGATVTVTAMTTDDTVDRVTFLWKNPKDDLIWEVTDNTRTADGEYDGKTVYAFSSANVPTGQGDWGVQALFQGADGKTKQGIEEAVAIKATSFLVVPYMPVIGTLGATAAAFLGLGLFTARSARYTCRILSFPHGKHREKLGERLGKDWGKTWGKYGKTWGKYGKTWGKYGKTWENLRKYGKTRERNHGNRTRLFP